MGLNIERHFKCDMCDKKETISGCGYPPRWMIDVVIKAFSEGHECDRKSLKADFCFECSSSIFEPFAYGSIDVPQNEFKKPWWQKFWFGTKPPLPTNEEA